MSRSQLRKLGAALALSLAPMLTAADSGPTLSQRAAGIRADALRSYAAGAYEAYLSSLVALSELLPNHPDVAIRLAAAQARTGHNDEALATLDAIADMGVTIDLAADKRNEDDFRSVSGKPAFTKWLARMKANAEPRIASTAWHTFAEPGLLTEDVSHDAKGDAFYVSSILKHKVVRVDRDGRESAFPLEAPEKNWNVLGVEVDAQRGVLWVSAQAIRGYPGIKPGDAGKSRLSAYGLKSKRRLYSREFKPVGDDQASIADIAVAPDSQLFASDSEQARLYRVAADRTAVDLLAQPFISPQDIAFSADGTVAFVADYARGIARIDLVENGEQEWLRAGRGIALSGIDGLYVHGNGLLAVQNGTHPRRIAYFTLGADNRSVTRCDVLERGPELGEPTHGVIVGNDFYYLANTGWDKVDAKGAIKPEAKTSAPVLRKLKLP